MNKYTIHYSGSSQRKFISVTKEHSSPTDLGIDEVREIGKLIKKDLINSHQCDKTSIQISIHPQ